MNNNNDITIIIVLYEEIEKVIIENLKNLNNFDVILFDNSNNTKLKKSISKRFNVKKYVLSAKNLGFSRAYNEAIKLCKTEFVLILNADCIIKEESIIKLKQELLNSKDCIMTTPTSYDNFNNITWSSGLLPENNNEYLINHLEGNICVESALGAAMFLRKKDFENLKQFDDRFFIYFSDFDLCRKIKEKNKAIIQVFDAKCIHTHGLSKVKNKYKKIFLREHFYLLDQLKYYQKADNINEIYKYYMKKKYKYFLKILFSLAKLNLEYSVKYFSKWYAIEKFEKYYYKINS